MSQMKYRRRKILVDRKFQLGISMKIVVCLACYLVLFCLMAVFSPFLVLLSGTASEETMQAASTEVLVFVKNLLLPLTLTFVCLALHCILLTHRIAGPAFRFKRTFEAMEDGDLSIDVHLRKGDYLTDIAESYNHMIGVIREDVGELKELAGGLLERARRAGTEGAGKDLLADAEKMNELLAAYQVARDEGEPGPGSDPEASETPVEEEQEAGV